MRTRHLLPTLALACLISACAHRYPVKGGGARDAVAGLPVRFGSLAHEVPAGTRIVWDFGDGQQAEGAQVEHAFGRAGEYRVRMEVTDGDGTRVALTQVRAARRPPAAALPMETSGALVFDRLWARLPRQLALAERFKGAEATQASLLAAERILGFDPIRPERLREAGIDPEEGLALAWMPEDDGVWVVIGVFDEQAALGALRAVVAKEPGARLSPGPEGSFLAEVFDTRLLFFTRGGYLYVYLADEEEDGVPAGLALVLRAGDDGLLGAPDFAAARASVSGDDLLLFVRGGMLPEGPQLPSDLASVRSHLTAFTVGVTVGEDALAIEALAALEAPGREALGRLLAAPRRLDLASLAPAGAAGFLSLSLSPRTLAGWLQEAATGPLDAPLREALGFDPSQLAGLLTGEIAVAAYADPADVVAGLVLGGEEALPGVELLVGLGLAEGADVHAAVGGAAVAAGAAPKPASGPVSRWEHDGRGGVAVTARGLLAGAAGPLEGALSEDPARRRLAGALERALPAQTPGLQLLYLDVAGVVDGLRSPPPAEGEEALRSGLMAAMVSGLFEDPSSSLHPLLPLRDVLLQVRPDPLGLAGSLTLRLR